MYGKTIYNMPTVALRVFERAAAHPTYGVCRRCPEEIGFGFFIKHVADPSASKNHTKIKKYNGADVPRMLTDDFLCS